jgi:predicted metal-dependent phosphoesterase TrpH
MPPAAPTFDLQSHSTHSDGELAPADVVARAAAAGVRLLALTDHDSIDGVGEALEAAAAHGITCVPAAEISALDDRGDDLHILGYQIDHTARVLRDALRGFREDRLARADALLTALREVGFELDPAPLARRKLAGESIGRPHLAQAVVAHPANAQRLQAEGLHTADAVLEAYLIPGKPAFRPRKLPTVSDTIALIHDAGGLAVWAHPFWDFDHDEVVLETIDRFAALRIDGVEVFYIAHTAAQTKLAYDRCRDLSLLTTGSADFHGPGHPRFHAFRAFDLHGLTPELGPIAP